MRARAPPGGPRSEHEFGPGTLVSGPFSELLPAYAGRADGAPRPSGWGGQRVGTQNRSFPARSSSRTPPFRSMTVREPTLSTLQVTRALSIPSPRATISALPQHRGRVASAPGRRPDVVADVATHLQERWRQPMADADAAQELTAVDPPELRGGDEPGGPRRFLEAQRADLLDERPEGFVARPGVLPIAEVADRSPS